MMKFYICSKNSAKLQKNPLTAKLIFIFLYKSPYIICARHEYKRQNTKKLNASVGIPKNITIFAT